MFLNRKSARSRFLASTLLAGAASIAAPAALTFVAFAPTVASAQDYTSGILGGRVTNEAGEPVSGAMVTVTSNQGSVRSATTGADGTFRIPALPIGGYRATISATGLTTLSNQAISVGSGGSNYDFTLTSGDGSVSAVVITGTRRVQDFNRTDTGLTVDVQDLADRVPVGRSINSVIQLAPGVSQPDATINASARRTQSLAAISGTSAAESVYYINGLNVTDQRNFLGYSDLPFEAIQTIDVKTGGYQAEFGRGTGGVLNIVTKSGSNDFHFGASAYWSPNSLREERGLAYFPGGSNSVGGQTFNQTSSNEFNEQTVWASGPIWKDHLFFFGLYNTRESEQFNGASFSTPTAATGTLTRFRSNDPRWLTKFDFVLNANHRVEATLFSDKATTDVQQFSYDRAAQSIRPIAGTTDANGGLAPYWQQSGGLNQIYKYTGVFTDWFTLSALYGKVKASQADYGLASTYPGVLEYGGTGGLPGGSYLTAGRATSFQLSGDDIRKTYRIDGDLYFNALGKHHVRLGYDREELTSVALNAYSGGAYYQAYSQAGCASSIGIESGPMGCIYQVVFTNNGTFKAEQSAAYIQDSWDISPNLNIQLGLRSDIYDYLNAFGDSYVKIDGQFAPRLGFNWDPTGNGNDRIYGSFGDYYLPIATNTSIRASSGEVFTETVFEAVRNGPCVTTAASCGALTLNNGIPSLGEQLYLGYLSPPGVPDPRQIAEQDLKPMYERELILGYEHTFRDEIFNGMFDGWRFGARAIYRNLKKGIEDTAIGDAVYRYCQRTNIAATCNPGGASPGDFSSAFPYVLVNPGDGARVFVDLQGDPRTLGDGSNNPDFDPQFIDLTAEDLSLPKIKRTYKALELQFSRPFDGRWSMGGSYTLARSKGNYEGAVKSDVGQVDTSLTQDYDHAANMLGAYGYLPNDHRHTFKLFGNFAPTERLNVGVNFSAQSGRPYGCLGVVPTSVDPLAPQAGTPSGWYCPTGDGAALANATGSIATQLTAINAPLNRYVSTPTPRGSVGRTEWVKQVDLNLSYTLYENEARGALTAKLDVFNLFDSDAVTRVVEQGEVRTAATGVKGVPAPYFGLPRTYQSPRTVRFGLSYAF